jgi:hypothetical protein
MLFQAYEPRDYEYTTLDDGLYTRHQVFAQNHPANALQSHLPRNGDRVYGVVVKDHTVIGIQIKLNDYERAQQALQTVQPVKTDVPPPQPIPEAARAVSVPVAHGAKDWSKASWPEIRAEFVKRNWPQKGTMAERIEKLTQEG